MADIAGAAGVPLGNVYYYFKTKDSLVSAVARSYARAYADMSTQLDQELTPRAG